VAFEIIDSRSTLPPVAFNFQGTLKPFQEAAGKDIMARDFGTLSAPTGCGKTIMALAVIAERKQPTLIVVHTKELLNQWVDRIGAFLGIPREEIGIIGAGKKTLGEKITVALVQSLYKCAEEVAPHIGHLVVDECHRAPSRTFTEAVTGFDSRYMLGLSATPWRRDGLSRLIFWYVGDLAHEVSKPDLIETGDVLRADVITRETDFQTSFDPSEEYTRMLSELTQDPGRNVLIAKDVLREANNGDGICLVLSDRKAHCEELRDLIQNLRGGVLADILTGDVGAKERQEVVERLNNGQVKVLVATGQLIGEGFDCRELSTLFLATPIKFDGRVIQYLGRVLRPAPGKENAVVYDYVDAKVPVLMASAKSRARVYRKECAAE
jgi:superfamily II DNA or RNA helicase